LGAKIGDLHAKDSGLFRKRLLGQSAQRSPSRNDRLYKILIIFISTNIAPIKAILDLLKLLKLKETSNYTKIFK